jgi:hypothetical protein
MPSMPRSDGEVSLKKSSLPDGGRLLPTVHRHSSNLMESDWHLPWTSTRAWWIGRRIVTEDRQPDRRRVAEAAEEDRAVAEAGRLQAEEERAVAEELRRSTESAREQAEDERVYAEKGRGWAESSRLEAESLREATERARVAAEGAREAAEAARGEARARTQTE